MISRRVLVLTLAAVAVAVPLRAQAYTWLGDRSPDWHDPDNWSPRGVPGTGSTATIEVGGRYTPEAYNARCDTLVVRPGASIAVDSLTARAVSMQSNSTMDLSGSLSVSGPFDNLGRIDGSNGSVDFTGSGTVNGQMIHANVNATDRTFLDVRIEGRLYHSAGVLRIRRTNVQLGADFQGTTVVSGSTDSYLILGSSVTWHTRNAVSDPPRTIDIYGNWDSDPSVFVPTTGVVVFRGSPSTVTGSSIFHDIRVASGDGANLQSPTTFTGSARIDGTVSGAALISRPAAGAARVEGTGSVYDLTMRGDAFLAGLTIDHDLTVQDPGTDVTVEGTVTVRRNVYVSTDSAYLRGERMPMAILRVTGNCECSGHYELLGNMELSGDLLIRPSATVAPIDGRIIFKAPRTHVLSSTANTNPALQTVVVERGATLDITSVQNFAALEVNGTVTVRDWANGSHGAMFARSLVVAAGATFRYQDQFVPFQIGALPNAPGSLRVDGTATVLGASNTIVGDAIVNGTLTFDPGSTLRLDGSGIATGTFPGATVTGALRRLLGATFNGDVQHDAGVLQVGIAVVNGALTARGTTLAAEGNADDSLTVVQDLEIATTGMSTQLPGVIRVRRNWRSSPTFQPQTGLVLFEGSSAQNARGTATNDVAWHEMQVGTGASLFLDGALRGGDVVLKGQLTMTANTIALSERLIVQASARLNGTAVTTMRIGSRCSVAGTVDVPQATADVRGRFEVLAGSQVHLGSGSHLFGGDVTVAGALSFAPTSAFVFDGAGAVTAPPSLVLPNVAVAGTYELRSATIGGNLHQRPGAGPLGVGTLRVGGSAFLLGGRLWDAGSGAGVLDVAGGVLMAGAGVVAEAAPEIRCGTEWAANRAFLPTSGRVVLTGAAPPPARLRALEGALAFHELELRGTVTTTDVQEIWARTCRVTAPNGGLALPTAPLTLHCDVLTCDGTLAVPAGGRLVLGPMFAPAATVDIGAAGRLWVVGQGGRPAVVAGTHQGSYGLAVGGTLEAAEFEFRDMNAAGIRILAGATIGPAPLDLRGGVFGSGASGPGSVLLDVARSGTQPALTLRGLVFDNRDRDTRFNVRTTTSVPIHLSAADGNFHGEAFEDDPNRVIEWDPFTRTQLEWVRAEGALHRVDLTFRSLQEVDAQLLGVLRGDHANGPFDVVAGVVVPGGAPHTYAIVDRAVEPLRRYYYELVDLHSRAVLRSHGVSSARAHPATFGAVRVVGPSGFPSIEAALLDAGPGGTVLVETGTYPAFRVTQPAVIQPAAGARVQIDASSTPVQVESVSGPVALRGLEIVAAGSTGLSVRRCPSRIVLDGLIVRSSGPASAVAIEDCPQVALQGSTVLGAPMRLLRSVTFAWGAKVDDLQVLDHSRLTDVELAAGRVTIDATSSRRPLPGLAPQLTGDRLWHGGQTADLCAEANPFDLVAVFFSVGTGWYDLGAWNIEMVLGLGLESLQQPLFVGFADAKGSARFGMPIPAEAPELWGSALELQMLSVGLRTPPGRLSNLNRVLVAP